MREMIEALVVVLAVALVPLAMGLGCAAEYRSVTAVVTACTSEMTAMQMLPPVVYPLEEEMVAMVL